MARSYLRARTVFTSSLLAFPAALVLAACSSSSGTPGPSISMSFGDSGDQNKHDAGKHDSSTPKGDATVTDAAQEAAQGEAGVGAPCRKPSDCATESCEPMSLVGVSDAAIHFDAGVCDTDAGNCRCQVSTCTDGVKNGKETDVDCGGNCPACQYKAACSTGTDCVSKECGVGNKGAACATPAPTDGGSDAGTSACICELPTCADGVQNQDETDVDCGGSSCSECPTGKVCKVPNDCSSGVCTGLLCACPTGMTEAPTSSSVPYCIDTYEVTYAQYSTFVGGANQATIAGQPPECQWNTNFVPIDNWPQVGASAKNPVSNVDWCDAFAYCKSVGHHLCGAIVNQSTQTAGGDPVPIGANDGGTPAANDPSRDEWYNACSSEGQTIYSYGNTYNRGACNSADSPPQSTTGSPSVPPAQLGYTLDVSFPSCVRDACNTVNGLSTVSQGQTVTCDQLPPNSTSSTMPGCAPAFVESTCVGGSSTNVIYDLAGNLAEWENSCDGSTGTNDNCAVRGGSFDSTPPATTTECAKTALQPPMNRATQAADIGFRCCL